MSDTTSAAIVVMGDGGPRLASALRASGLEFVDGLASTTAPAVAVAVVGELGEDAIEAVAADTRVVGVALLGTRLSAAATRLLGGWKEVPVFVVADATDRASLPGAVDLHLASTHPDSDLTIVSDTTIPGEPDLCATHAEQLDSAMSAAISWMDRLVGAATAPTDVVCTTDDGWQIHGTLIVPERDVPVPAAILMHSGRSDRAVFSRLERLIARRGVATLNIDWRGRGMSTNKGTYFDLSDDDRQQGWRDARAALDLLAGDPRIDSQRVAMIGVVHGAEHAVAASIGDSRVVGLVLLTGYMPRDEREEAHLLSGAVRVLYVTSAGHGPVVTSMRELARRSPPGVAEFRDYPGGAIGYQLFDLDPSLEEHVAAWVAEAVSAGNT